MNNKIFIPTFISDDKYNPARVQPRLFYYNGLIDAATWRVNVWTNATGTTTSMLPLTKMPYVDHYNVVQGETFPTAESNSLLFYNELSSYGVVPTKTLYSEYWETYIQLLYNPRTRLIDADAVIPLADYFDIELNDIIEWRSNYYHLRAVNEYSFTTGECKLQLLGPIIADSFSEPLDGKPCYSYDIYGDGESVTTFSYTDCDGEASQQTLQPQATGFIPCARPGTVTFNRQGASFSQGVICGSFEP